MECHRIVLQNKRGLEGALKLEGGRRKGRGRGRGGGGKPATIADCVTSLHEVEGQCVYRTIQSQPNWLQSRPLDQTREVCIVQYVGIHRSGGLYLSVSHVSFAAQKY